MLRGVPSQDERHVWCRSTSANSGSLCSVEYGLCGSWVPLMIERHHGSNVRPVQNEPTDAPRLRALQVVRQGLVEMDGLSRNNAETPVPHRPLYADGHLRLNVREQTVPAPFFVHALQMAAGKALTFIVANILLNCLITQIPTWWMMKRTLSSLPQGSRQRQDCACSWQLGDPCWPL